MLRCGIRAVITCVDPHVIPEHFVGRKFDEAFLADLPDGVDPCGERGEFHTFVYDGPGFCAPIDIEVGEVVCRDGFVFCDVLTEA
jgi:diphthamide synthase (EF-2-diphthine--ammonia ligase)